MLRRSVPAGCGAGVRHTATVILLLGGLALQVGGSSSALGQMQSSAEAKRSASISNPPKIVYMEGLPVSNRLPQQPGLGILEAKASFILEVIGVGKERIDVEGVRLCPCGLPFFDKVSPPYYIDDTTGRWTMGVESSIFFMEGTSSFGDIQITEGGAGRTTGKLIASKVSETAEPQLPGITYFDQFMTIKIRMRDTGKIMTLVTKESTRMSATTEVWPPVGAVYRPEKDIWYWDVDNLDGPPVARTFAGQVELGTVPKNIFAVQPSIWKIGKETVEIPAEVEGKRKVLTGVALYWQDASEVDGFDHYALYRMIPTAMDWEAKQSPAEWEEIGGEIRDNHFVDYAIVKSANDRMARATLSESAAVSDHAYYRVALVKMSKIGDAIDGPWGPWVRVDLKAYQNPK